MTKQRQKSGGKCGEGEDIQSRCLVEAPEQAEEVDDAGRVPAEQAEQVEDAVAPVTAEYVPEKKKEEGGNKTQDGRFIMWIGH